MEKNIMAYISSAEQIDVNNTDVLLAIKTPTGYDVVGKYDKRDVYYKFDVLTGNIKTVELNSNMEHVDADLFSGNMRIAWYANVMRDMLAIEKDLSIINHDSIVSYYSAGGMVDVDKVKEVDAKLLLIKSRVDAVKAICADVDIYGSTSATIANIANVLYYGSVNGYDSQISNIQTALDSVNAQVDKDNDNINIADLKKAMGEFTRAFWIADPAFGVGEYTYNTNTRMVADYLTHVRKRQIKEGVGRYNMVKVKKTLKDLVWVMIIRLQAMAGDKPTSDKPTSDKKSKRNDK